MIRSCRLADRLCDLAPTHGARARIKSQALPNCGPLPPHFSVSIPSEHRVRPGGPMPHRTVKCVSAIICLAGSVLISASTNNPAYASDECLSGPKGATPAGKHWYYRIDRPARKHCWYLGDEGGRTSKAANAKPVEAAALAQEDTTQENPPAQSLEPSIANARAEFPPANATISIPPQTTQPSETTPDVSMTNEDTGRLTERDLITQKPVTLASRWPLPNEFQPTQTEPSTREAAQNSADSPKQQTPDQKADTPIGPLQIFLCGGCGCLPSRWLLPPFSGTRFFDMQPTYAANRPHSSGGGRSGRTRCHKTGVRPSYAQMVTPERRARTMRADREVTDEIEQLLRGVSRRNG